jgi:hypothetical protein
MPTLTKVIKTTFVPGAAGSPGIPPQPAVPGYFKTVVSAYEPQVPTFYWDDELDRLVFLPAPTVNTGTNPGNTTSIQVWVPPVPYRPGVPGTPSTPSSVIQDARAGWNAGAISRSVLGGNCELDLKISPSVVGIVCGVGSTKTSSHYREIDYAIYFTRGSAKVYEGGVAKTTSIVPFTATDKFTIRRIGKVVTYSINGKEFYKSTKPSSGTVFANASMYLAGDTILDTAFRVAAGAMNASSILAPLTGMASTGPYRAAVSLFSPLSGSSLVYPSGQATSLLRSLTGLSSTAAYREARSVLSPLGGTSGFFLTANCNSRLMPLIGRASEGAYSDARSVLSPVSGEASNDEITPDFTTGFSHLSYLLGTSLVLTGEIGQATVVMRPMGGLSANRSYAEARCPLLPLESQSLQVPAINNYLHLRAPSPILRAKGRSSVNNNSFDYDAPSPTLTAFAGANGKLTAPRSTISATATGTNFGSAAIRPPAATLSASGTVTMLGSAALTGPMQRLVGYSGAVCSISVLGAPTLTATGTTGSIGGAQLTAPLFELTAVATAQNRGSALLTAPSPKLGGQAQAYLIAPGATLVAIGSAVVTATYEAYALNLNHVARRGQSEPVDETTRYTNFPFTHVVRYQNSYFGANSTGLYLLEGTTDDGVAIPWDVQTHMTDFDTAQKKTVEMAYFGGRMGPAATVSLLVGEVGPTTYSYTTPRGDTAQNYRQAFGRGLKSRYYALGAAGDGELSIDSITFNVAVTTRKV